MQVRVHEEGEKEKDGEVQVEVEREVEELRENRTSWMTCRWSDRLKDDLSQCGVTRDEDTYTNGALLCSLVQVVRVVIVRCHSCWCTLCHCCPHWS